MKCEKIRIKLSAYMDGEVDAGLRQRIESHLEQCAACREELEGIGGIDALLRDLPLYELPADFVETVAARVGDSSSPRERHGLVRRAWKSLLVYAEKYLDLLSPETRGGTRSLDEFNDIPVSFIGYAYFRVLGEQR